MAKRKRQTTQWPKEKDRQHNGQKKKTDNTIAKRKKEQTPIYKTPHLKIRIEQNELFYLKKKYRSLAEKQHIDFSW
jgi:hypothetical protein